jgi:serine/threonine protein kinase
MSLSQVINKEELCREENKMFLVEKEIEIMSQLDHPNIVKLYEVYVNDEEVGQRLGLLKTLPVS